MYDGFVKFIDEAQLLDDPLERLNLHMTNRPTFTEENTHFDQPCRLQLLIDRSETYCVLSRASRNLDSQYAHELVTLIILTHKTRESQPCQYIFR